MKYAEWFSKTTPLFQKLRSGSDVSSAEIYEAQKVTSEVLFLCELNYFLHVRSLQDYLFSLERYSIHNDFMQETREAAYADWNKLVLILRHEIGNPVRKVSLGDRSSIQTFDATKKWREKYKKPT